MVMPFYDGETLERRIKRAPLSLRAGVHTAMMLARAVDALHRLGVVHRDIKPDNVILTRDGGLRLIDLGVARGPGMEESPTPAIPGTSSFMAPEMFEGRSTGDVATDLYALGVSVYRSFTGDYPYGEVEPFTKPRFAKYVSISRARPDLPAWLDAILAKAVSVDPTRRFADATELSHELEEGLARGNSVAVPRGALLERNPVRFWQLASLALLFALLALLATRLPHHLK